MNVSQQPIKIRIGDAVCKLKVSLELRGCRQNFSAVIRCLGLALQLINMAENMQVSV